MKVFAASQAKLNTVLKMTKEAMEDIGLQWNPKKCNVLNVRRGVPVDIPEGLSLIHISEPTRRVVISYAVFCLKKKK